MVYRIVIDDCGNRQSEYREAVTSWKRINKSSDIQHFMDLIINNLFTVARSPEVS